MPIPVGGNSGVDTSTSVSVSDLATYLNNPSIDPVRAQFIIDRATTLCLSVVNPLPAGADVVILDVTERAFANPTSTSTDRSLGLYQEGVGGFNSDQPGLAGGGLYLSDDNEKTLRRLAKSGGAFTIDTTPVGAGLNLPPWDYNNWSFG